MKHYNLTNTNVVKNQRTFRSQNHDVFTIESAKIALSAADDKRVILPGNVETLAYGHYKLNA